MRTFKRSSLPVALSLLVSTVAFSAACGDDGSDESTGPTTNNPTTSTEPTTGGPGDPTGDPTGSPSTDPTTTTTTTTTDTTTTTTDPTTTTEPTTGGGAFVFDTTPPENMVQLDRMGMPAVATAVISADLKDSYNESSPLLDAEGTFVDDIVKNVTGLHTALDDDLTGLGLTPCMAQACVNQAAPLVVPDTLQIDVNMPAGFPNGRRLEDKVVDITLAVVLLDLSVPMQTPASLIGTNPETNDKEFLPDFPYLATPH